MLKCSKHPTTIAGVFLIAMFVVGLYTDVPSFVNDPISSILYNNVLKIFITIFAVCIICIPKNRVNVFQELNLDNRCTYIGNAIIFLGIFLIIKVMYFGLPSNVSVLYRGREVIQPYIIIAMTYISSVIFAGITEEILFRHVIYRSINNLTNQKWFTFLTTALMFGLVHNNLGNMWFYITFSFITQYLYNKTNNLWLPIVIHGCVNFISTTNNIFGT